MKTSPIRILVAEDFFPFRDFIRSKLSHRRDLRVICEVGNGQEAVRKTEELRPDLILLDIGLPTLNGIEAARQIRQLTPESKIIFVSQVSSPEVVQEAISLGTCSYVVKTKAERDLLAAIDAALQGRLFVSLLDSG